MTLGSLFDTVSIMSFELDKIEQIKQNELIQNVSESLKKDSISFHIRIRLQPFSG